MVRNEEKYQLATYYRKRGFSYAEISKIVGVSKGTVSNWLSQKTFSKKVKKENVERAARENVKRISLLNKARQAERTTRYREAVRSASTEYKHYKQNPLFTAGLMLYLGSGDTKDPNTIRFSSSTTAQHRIFHKFTREFLGAEAGQIKFWLLLYHDLSETKCRAEWTKQLRLKPEQWYKNQMLQAQQRRPTLHCGVGNTIIGSTVLKHKLNRWIELATKELSK